MTERAVIAIKKCVEHALAENGKNKKWLAGEIGMRPEHLTRILQSGTTSLDTLYKMAKAFNLKLSDFIALGGD